MIVGLFYLCTRPLLTLFAFRSSGKDAIKAIAQANDHRATLPGFDRFTIAGPGGGNLTAVNGILRYVCMFIYIYKHIFIQLCIYPNTYPLRPVSEAPRLKHIHLYIYIYIYLCIYTYTYLLRPVSEAPPAHAYHRHKAKQGLIEDGFVRDDLLQVCV